MLTKSREKMEELEKNIGELEQKLQAALTEKEELLTKLNTQKQQSEQRVRSLELRVDSLEKRLDGYENVIVNLQNNNVLLETLGQTAERLLARQSKLDRLVKARPENTARTEGEDPSKDPIMTIQSRETADSYNVIDYFDFENHFRGSRQSIKERQKQYLDYFKGCTRVVDIGCGRGEFLELMKENHIPAVGVDTYEEFVDYCTEKGFQAVRDDGIHYLKTVENADGIFVGQVVEHLKTEQIVDLCHTAYEKLKKGGRVIMETPNPTSLAIYTHAFYMDPSHVKPVHPLTLEYFLQKAGFHDIKILYTESSRINMEIPELQTGSSENTEAFNKAMRVVSDTLFGSQDYAIIGTK